MMAACGLVLGGCGDDEETAAPPTPESVQEQLAEAREQVAEATEQGEESEVNPCEVLTEAVIRSTLDAVPEDAEIEQRRGSTRMTSKLCTYTWPNPDFDQEEHTRNMMKRMRERMRKGGTTEGIMELAMSARASAEINYTHMPELDSPEAAEAQFESIVRMLDRGISQEVEAMGKTTKVTIQSSMEPVEGVGDEASWSARMQQLTVRNGAQIFHLSVKVEDEAEANLELTKQLARALIDA